MRLRLGELSLRGEPGEVTAVLAHLLQHHLGELGALMGYDLPPGQVASNPRGVLIPLCSADDLGAVTAEALAAKASQALLELSRGGFSIHSAVIAFPGNWTGPLFSPGGLLQTNYGPLVMVPWGGCAECLLHAVISR